jgi:NTE family protein
MCRLNLLRGSRRTLCFLWFISIALYAQQTTIRPEYTAHRLQFGLESQVPVQQPTIGLALSGGGARAFSQIGILKAFVEKNIPIDLICGTSMGSIVGGLFSLGYSPFELDSIASNTDWDDLLSSNARSNRRDLFLDKKVTEDKSVFAIRLNGLKPILPTSINDGQKLTNYLNILSFQAPIRLQENFNDLDTRFRAICTDLVKGQPVILRSGSIAEALRASSSVSFLLSPIVMDSVTLVDGGLVANIPVEITRKEGADFVIAVNATSNLHGKQELELPWFVADQIVSIPMEQLNLQQLKKADLIITPEIPRISSTDFKLADSAISAGYRAALPLCDSIKKIISAKFIKRLQKGDTTYTNCVLESAPLPLQDRFRTFFSNSVRRKSEILALIYEINQFNEYSDFSVTVDGRNDTSFISVHAKLQPKIESFVFTGNSLIQNDSVSTLLNSLTQRPYSERRIMNTTKKILGYFRDMGYSLAEIDSITFGQTDHILRLYFNPGVVDEIQVVGLARTNPRVIRREIPIKNGDVFLSSNFKKALTNLRALGIFNNIIVSFEHRKEGNTLIFHVDERSSGIARLGFKVDNENFPQINIDIRDENLFGLGSEAGLTMFLSQRGKAYEIDQRSNRLFDSYYSYDFKGFFRFNDIYTYKYSQNSTSSHYFKDVLGEYRQVYYGFSLALARQFERFGDVVVRGNFEMDRVKNLHDAELLEFSTRIVSINASTTIDTRDRYPYPNRGLRFNAYYEIATSALGSQAGYTNFGGKYLFIVPLGSSHTLSTSAKLGFADQTLPLTQQYSLGGQYSFFGMRENESRGKQIFLASIEYRYLLPFRLFFDNYIQVRYDLGQVWDKIQSQLKIADLNHGIGATLSFDTPVGPADFSVGRTFTFLKDVKDNPIRFGPVYFYFSIGFYY